MLGGALVVFGVCSRGGVISVSWLFIYPFALVRLGLSYLASVPRCNRLFKRSSFCYGWCLLILSYYWLPLSRLWRFLVGPGGFLNALLRPLSARSLASY